jgi:hypothetical protein
MKRHGPVLLVRRRLLRGAWLLPLLALAPRPAPAATIGVRRFGARGDGHHDDTLALQRAVDAVPDGGILDVPAGSYLVDPVRSVRLRGRMHLRLARGARLVAKPNAAPRGYVLLVERASDVRISGGGIVGERHAHLGSTGEWGHGIMVRGASRVSIANMRISDCWGDGISIGASKLGGGRALPSSDITITGVTCAGNRRQGLTIGRSRRVRVRDCEFSGTGGTAPQAGIDIEPDAMSPATCASSAAWCAATAAPASRCGSARTRSPSSTAPSRTTATRACLRSGQAAWTLPATGSAAMAWPASRCVAARRGCA